MIPITTVRGPLYEYNVYEYNILLPVLMLEIGNLFPKPCAKALFASKHTLFLFQNYHLAKNKSLSTGAVQSGFAQSDLV